MDICRTSKLSLNVFNFIGIYDTFARVTNKNGVSIIVDKFRMKEFPKFNNIINMIFGLENLK